MAPTLSASIQAYSYIAITPNTVDNWSSASPFSGYDLTGGKTGFILATIATSALSTYVLVPSKLTDIGVINRSVDIFNDNATFRGVGGVAKLADVSFSLENISDTILYEDLMGRTVTICIGTGSSLKDVGDTTVATLFIGKVFSIEPSRYSLSFTVRGRFQQWVDKEIGTLIEGTNETYKSKIIPIQYGQLDYMPIVINGDLRLYPKLIIDTSKLFSIDNFNCWDEEGKVAYKAIKALSDFTLNTDQTQVTLNYQDDECYLQNALNATSGLLVVEDAPTVAFEFSTSPTLSVGDVYKKNGASYYYKYKEKIDTYYIFKATTTDADTTGTLDLVYSTGSPPASIAYTFKSSLLDQFLKTDKTKEEKIRGIIGIASPVAETGIDKVFSSAKTQPNYIQIGSEVMLIYDERFEVDIDGAYSYTVYNVFRGVKGTTKATHAQYALVKKMNTGVTANRWLVKHIFPVREFSNFKLVGSEDTDVVSLSESYGTIDDMLSNFAYPAVDKEHKVQLKLESTGDRGKAVVLDLHFDKVSIDADIASMYLLGYFDIARGSLILSKGNKAGMYKNVGYNKYFAKLTGLVDFNFKNRDYPSHVYDPNSSSLYHATFCQIVINSNTIGEPQLPNFCNNPIDPSFNNVEEGFTIRGGWFAGSLPPAVTTQFHYVLDDSVSSTFLDWVGSDVNPATMYKLTSLNSDVYKLVFLNSDSSNAYLAMANLAFRIDFYVDPIKTQFWAQGSGRVYPAGFFNGTADTLIENPVSIIEDLFRTELGLASASLDETTFDAAYLQRQAWPMSFSIFGDPITFREILERISRTAALVVGETHDGKVSLDSITIPITTSGLTQIADAQILRKNNVISYTEEYTELSKLITDLTIRYNYRYPDETYQSILNTTGLGWDDLFDEAEGILDTTNKVTMDLDIVKDETVVTLVASNTIPFYYKPLRILTVETTLAYYALRIGQWVTLSSIIRDTSGKVYLIVSVDMQVPCKGKDAGMKIVMIEKSLDAETAIQEVPNASEQWAEVPDTTDTIQEVPDA